MLYALDISSSHECELWHRSHLNHLLGVCKSTTNHVVMEELGRHPLCFSWLKQSLKFWNKIMKRDVDDLVHLALIESANLSHGWVNDLNCALKNLGCTSRSCIGRPFDVDLCIEEAKANWSHKYTLSHLSVRNYPSNGFKSFKYANWFARTGDGSTLSFIQALHRPDQIRIVSQFRTCSHWLNCEKQRQRGKSTVPRAERTCQLCQYQKVEDEMHLFECPFYNDIRRLFSPFLANKVDNHNLNNDVMVWMLKGICYKSVKRAPTHARVCPAQPHTIAGPRAVHRQYSQLLHTSS